jgi:hypothetical protein
VLHGLNLTDPKVDRLFPKIVYSDDKDRSAVQGLAVRLASSTVVVDLNLETRPFAGRNAAAERSAKRHDSQITHF